MPTARVTAICWPRAGGHSGSGRSKDAKASAGISPSAITTKAQGKKLDAAKKFLAFVTSPEAMEIWLKTVGELPARRAVALTEKNLADPIYGPFLKALDYAQTTLFVDETAQRQISIDMVNRVLLQNQEPKASLAEAAKAEQALLDRYYAGKR